MNRSRLPFGRATSRLFAFTAAITGVLLAFAAAPASAAVPTGRYVALGDSYTAGPLIPTQTDLNCLRSNRNYPSLVAASAGSSSFADVSCSGAKTGDILYGGDGQTGPLPPQLSAVTPDTALVTVQIGGNDVGFSGIITTCAEESLSSPFGSPCKDKYTAGGTDQLQARIAATAPKVTSVLQAIRQIAPGARIVVLGYPAIVPDSGNGCWPVVPIAYQDVPYLRSVHKSLNAMLATTAAANNARYADVYTPSIGRDTCKSSGTRWVEGLIPQNSAAPFHPNARGEQGMATALLATLNS